MAILQVTRYTSYVEEETWKKRRENHSAPVHGLPISARWRRHWQPSSTYMTLAVGAHMREAGISAQHVASRIGQAPHMAVDGQKCPASHMEGTDQRQATVVEGTDGQRCPVPMTSRFKEEEQGCPETREPLLEVLVANCQIPLGYWFTRTQGAVDGRKYPRAPNLRLDPQARECLILSQKTGPTGNNAGGLHTGNSVGCTVRPLHLRLLRTRRDTPRFRTLTWTRDRGHLTRTPL